MRCTKSLRDLLVRTDMQPQGVTPSTLPAAHYRCGGCNVCPLTIETKRISLPDINFAHSLTSFSNCRSQFTIYMLECSCPKRYVGSTKRQLRTQVQEHISRMKHGVVEAPLTQHSVDNKHAHNDFRVVVLEVIQFQPYRDRNKLLLQRKVFWTYKLRTLHPYETE